GRARGGTVPLVLPRGGHPQSELVRSPAVRLAQSRHRLARRRAHRRGAAMMRRPITVLIAALGGEGGGVITNWVVAAAARHGLAVQSTSIPGVAQRTGATTYYVEVMPTPAAELGGQRPVFALHPGIGDVDVLVASELLEAARAVAAGFASPDRTCVIA